MRKCWPYQCHCCGKKFRTPQAEARHRHNFPALCNKSSATWKAFQKQLEDGRDDDDRGTAVPPCKEGPNEWL